jgi:hypothetical protein
VAGDAAGPVAPEMATGRGAGQRANERAIIPPCPFSVARFFRGSSSSVSAAPRRSTLVVRLLEMVERIASPSAPPTCEVALSRPGASRSDAVGGGNRHRYERQLETNPGIKADGIATPTV